MSGDIEILTTCAALLESLSLDSEAVKQEIALGLFVDEPVSVSSDTLLSQLFDFIQHAKTPTSWKVGSEISNQESEKAVSRIKTATVMAVVEARNSERVIQDVMEESMGYNWIVEPVREWTLNADGEGESRDDLLICATHMLAALGRTGAFPGKHCYSGLT